MYLDESHVNETSKKITKNKRKTSINTPKTEKGKVNNLAKWVKMTNVQKREKVVEL